MQPIIPPSPMNRQEAAHTRLERRVRAVFYRIRQFIDGLFSFARPEDESPAQALLSPAELVLFRRMPVDARRHSLHVLKTLRCDGEIPHELAVAALLHDVGKVAARDVGAYLGLWLRGPIVLAEALAPAWLHRLEDSRPSGGLRYALYVQAHHPEIGAEWERHAGGDALTCWLIEHHQDNTIADGTPEGALLARLQAADNAN